MECLQSHDYKIILVSSLSINVSALGHERLSIPLCPELLRNSMLTLRKNKTTQKQNTNYQVPVIQ